MNRTDTRAESLTFALDGRVTGTITEAEVGPTAWPEAIDHGFFIIFDLAMGGNSTADTAASINVDTTRVDRFGLKLALLVHSHGGSTQEVGEDYATFRETRAATFRRFGASVPARFRELATIDAPYGIPSPGDDPSFQPGGKYAAFWHANAINGRQYGFPYDDDANQSSDLSVASPKYMIVAVGW